MRRARAASMAVNSACTMLLVGERLGSEDYSASDERKDSDAQVSGSPLVSGKRKISAPPAARKTDVKANALPIPKRSARAPTAEGRKRARGRGPRCSIGPAPWQRTAAGNNSASMAPKTLK